MMGKQWEELQQELEHKQGERDAAYQRQADLLAAEMDSYRVEGSVESIHQLRLLEIVQAQGAIIHLLEDRVRALEEWRLAAAEADRK